jgi:hypothetical protein
VTCSVVRNVGRFAAAGTRFNIDVISLGFCQLHRVASESVLQMGQFTPPLLMLARIKRQ